MDKDDENYDLMVQERKAYMEVLHQEAAENSVKINAWEEEEIEMAFEHAFCKGYIAAIHHRRREDLN